LTELGVRSMTAWLKVPLPPHRATHWHKCYNESCNLSFLSHIQRWLNWWWVQWWLSRNRIIWEITNTHQSSLSVLLWFLNYFLQPRATKGISYIIKQCDGAATSSSDEEEEEDATSVVVELDEDEDSKLENPPQSPKMKASAIKKKREVVSFFHLCVISCSFLT